MNKSFAYPLMALLLASCSGGSNGPVAKPYKFDRDRLDKAVKENKMLYDIKKRNNGTLESETFYYTPDTGKFLLIYDERSNIETVYKFNEHGQEQWQENYYPNGQRMAHYGMAAFPEIGPRSIYHGTYETYYDDGKVKETGEYKRGNLIWQLEYDKEGQPGDTTHYEYPEERQVQKDTLAKPKKVKVEKIGTATTPN